MSGDGVVAIILINNQNAFLIVNYVYSVNFIWSFLAIITRLFHSQISFNMNSPLFLRLLLVFFILTMASKFYSQIIYIKQDAIGTKDGTSWENAYTDIETALASASDDSELWIAAGNYHPGSLNPNINSTFAIRHNISIYGGFAGIEVYLEERDPELNLTILSGDIHNDDVINDFTNFKSDNTQHVVYVDSLLSLVIIDGLTIKGGHTTDNGGGTLYQRAGGGVYALSPVNIMACRIAENFGRNGGGILLAGGASQSSIIGSTFSHNKTTDRGACIYALMISNIVIVGCSFKENKTSRGAVYPNNCRNIIIDNCLFQDNHNTVSNGGALFSFQNIDLLIRNCNFLRNSALFGGAIVINGSQLPIGTLSNARIEHCLFQDNIANEVGAIYCLTNPDISILKCEFINDSSINAGAVLIEQPANYPTDTSNIRIDSCLFRDNKASDFAAGALRLRYTSAKIEHCTFENNITSGLLNGGGGHVFGNCPGQNIIYREVTFKNGVSGGYAGAVTAYGKDAHYLFENCSFINNSSAQPGGAVHNALGALSTYKNCLFKDNNSNNDGGAMSLAHDSTSVYAENSTFSGNKAAGNGGAIISNGGSCIISLDNCRLDSNEAKYGFGGAIFIIETGDDNISTLTLNNSFFGFNISTIQAGAVNIVDADTRITSCLFYENTCTDLGVGGALAIKATDEDSMEATIINTTFVDNHGFFADGIAQETASIDAAITTKIQNCIFRNQGVSNYVVENGTPLLMSLGGNISDDESLVDILTKPKDLNQISPVFNDPSKYDFSLISNSPGIDGGIPDGAPEFDIIGNPRINAPDVGAYENQFPVGVKNTSLMIDESYVISPNPATGGSADLLINDLWFGHLEVKIMSLSGVVLNVLNVLKTSENIRIRIPLDELSPSIYQVIVSNGKEVRMRKMIRI